jgi:hypothetical protein
MSSVPEIVSAFWVVVGIGLALAWGAMASRWIRRSVPPRRHAQAVERFASAHGWDYRAADQLDTGFGDPFVLGEEPSCTNVVRGVLDGCSFTAFEYDIEAQVFMIDLPEGLPFLEVRPRTLAEQAGLGRRSVGVESIDFSEHWQVLAHSREYALAVLHPLLMSDLVTGPDVSWRILKQRLVAWRPGQLDSARIIPTIQLLRRIKNSIPEYVWEDYAQCAETPNPGDVLPN